MTTLPTAPTSVYQYYDKDGELLYVGITARGFSRGKEHERTKTWWPLVVSSSVEHYPNRHEAEIREAYLISFWRPPHNTVGRPSGPPRHRRELAEEPPPVERSSPRRPRPARVPLSDEETELVDGYLAVLPDDLPLQLNELRSFLGRLGRCETADDIDEALAPEPLKNLIDSWKSDSTPIRLVRAVVARTLAALSAQLSCNTRNPEPHISTPAF